MNKFLYFFKKYYYYFTWFLVSIFTLLIIESIWRGSLTEGLKFLQINYLIMIVNLIMVMMFFSITLFVKRRIMLTLLISFMLILVSIINKYVLIFRGNPFNMNDLTMLLDGIYTINKYFSVKMILCVLLTIVFWGMVIIFIGCLEAKKVNKLSKNTFITVFLFFMLGYATIKVIEPIALVKNIFNEKISYYDNGLVYSFFESYVDVSYIKPLHYSSENILDLKEYLEYSITEPVLSDLNFIFIQLESFFDPLILNNINFKEDPIPNFRDIFNNYNSGILSVPTFGGSTVRTEFEVLTQTNLDYFSINEIPYNTLGKKVNEIDSLAYYFNELGYTTTAFHNNTELFFNRKSVFGKLGFDEFWGIEKMKEINKTENGWYEDSGLIPYIENQIRETPTKDFVFGITVQLHGGYDRDISPQEKRFLDTENNQLSYYLSTINKIDVFIGEIIEMVNGLNEDSIIVFYSDHYPKLEILDDEKYFNNDKYEVPYVIYDNIGLLKNESKKLESYQLAAYVIELVGFNQGYLTTLHNKFNEEEWYQEAVELLQYDSLFIPH